MFLHARTSLHTICIANACAIAAMLVGMSDVAGQIVISDKNLILDDDLPYPSCGPTSFCAASLTPYTQEQLPLELYFVGPRADALTQEDVDHALTHAALAWTQVPCSFAQVVYAGTATSTDTIPAEAIAVLFVDGATHSCIPTPQTATTPTRIAAAPCPHDGRVAIVLNRADYTWAPSPDFEQQLKDGLDMHPRTVDLSSVLTHELGHILGLSHSNDFRRECAKNLPLATMAAGYLKDGGQATLSADDRSGICALYPIEHQKQTCTTHADCVTQAGEGSTCVQDDSGRSVCEEYRGGVGASCGHKNLSCTDLCLFTDVLQGKGYCTEACHEKLACPQGFVCSAAYSSTGKALCIKEDIQPGGCCSTAQGSSKSSPTQGLFILMLCCGAAIFRRRQRRWMK